MVGQALGQVLLVLAASLLQDRIAGDDPPLHLVQADLAAELDRLAGLEPRDHLRMRLEQRQQLLRRGDRVILQDRRSAWRTPCLSRGRTSPSRSASRLAPGSSPCPRRASRTRLPWAPVRLATATSRP